MGLEYVTQHCGFYLWNIIRDFKGKICINYHFSDFVHGCRTASTR